MPRPKLDVEYDHDFAIVRVDGHHRDVRDVVGEPEVAITVKKVVWSRMFAETEVERLNQLNADKGCVYSQMITRVERAGNRS